MSKFRSGLDPILQAFESLNIPYLIGGSVASSTFGTMRATNDIDFLCDLRVDQVERWAALIRPELPVFEEDVLHAIRHRRAFNLIHPVTVTKFDIFPANRPFDYSQLERRSWETTDVFGESLKAPLASPEDIILCKLDWFRKGGEVSEQQWRDIRGVIRVQHGRLDQTYLQEWAAELRVSDLLERALLLPE